MARRIEGQLELIEVKHAVAKYLEDGFTEYNAEIRKKNKAAKNAKEKKGELLAKIKKEGIKPDEDGTIRFRMNGKIWTVTQGDSKLNIVNDTDVEKTPEAPGDD